MIPTIEQEFDEYIRIIYKNLGKDTQQYKHLKKAFYAGAVVGIGKITVIADNEAIPNKEKKLKITDVLMELNKFHTSIFIEARDRSSSN